MCNRWIKISVNLLMLCNELTTKEATVSFTIILRTYGKTCFISIHILCSQHIWQAVILRQLCLRSAIVEIVFFFSHFGCAAAGKESDLWGLELFVKGGIIDLANVISMKKRSLNLYRCYVTNWTQMGATVCFSCNKKKLNYQNRVMTSVISPPLLSIEDDSTCFDVQINTMPRLQQLIHHKKGIGNQAHLWLSISD